jgi:hypothetical protein
MVGACTNDGGLPNQGWRRWLTLQHDHREKEVAPVFEDFSSPRFMVLGETNPSEGGRTEEPRRERSGKGWGSGNGYRAGKLGREEVYMSTLFSIEVGRCTTHRLFV